jgi:hypothetical protein
MSLNFAIQVRIGLEMAGGRREGEERGAEVRREGERGK